VVGEQYGAQGITFASAGRSFATSSFVPFRRPVASADAASSPPSAVPAGSSRDRGRDSYFSPPMLFQPNPLKFVAGVHGRGQQPAPVHLLP